MTARRAKPKLVRGRGARGADALERAMRAAAVMLDRAGERDAADWLRALLAGDAPRAHASRGQTAVVC